MLRSRSVEIVILFVAAENLQQWLLQQWHKLLLRRAASLVDSSVHCSLGLASCVRDYREIPQGPLMGLQKAKKNQN